MRPIRVMSFNVFSPGELEPGDELPPEELFNSWADRAHLNLRTIRKYDPDLIGFQELDGEKQQTYRSALDEYAWVEHTDAQAATIIWKHEVFDLIESGRFWLSRTPDQPSADWGVPYPLVVDWVRLRQTESGTHLLHLNTQFEDGPDGARSRLESSRLIVRRVAEFQERDHSAAIVSGDFNCNPWHPPYDVFMNHGYVDTYRAAGHGDSAASSTFHGLRGAGYDALAYGVETFWRVDWILTRDGAAPMRTTSCTIARDAEPPVYPSDHYPVVAEVLLAT